MAAEVIAVDFKGGKRVSDEWLEPFSRIKFEHKVLHSPGTLPVIGLQVDREIDEAMPIPSEPDRQLSLCVPERFTDTEGLIEKALGLIAATEFMADAEIEDESMGSVYQRIEETLLALDEDDQELVWQRAEERSDTL